MARIPKNTLKISFVFEKIYQIIPINIKILLNSSVKDKQGTTILSRPLETMKSIIDNSKIIRKENKTTLLTFSSFSLVKKCKSKMTNKMQKKKKLDV